MLGTRGIYHDGWKAASVTPASPDSWGDFPHQRWELFNTETDPSECHDLAGKEPEKLKELIELWESEAKKYNALPLDSRNVVEILNTERPQLAKPRNQYVYYTDCQEVPESVAVNIRNRSYAISAEVTIDTPEASGVLFAHGARFGGHALYIKEGKLKYDYNYVGEFDQFVESSKAVPTGKCVLSASFEKEGDATPTEGTLSLYIDDEKVGEGKIKTQPGKFSLAGEGLNVGLDRAEPVTEDYPGDSPWAFVGGTIHKVIVDVEGDPWVDLEKEVAAAFARD
jgi:arylsulfatase